MAIGYDQPLYLMPFDHRESLQTKMFGWNGTLSAGRRPRSPPPSR